MDAHRFDALARAISRRQAVRLLAGSALGGLLAVGPPPAAGADTARPALPKGFTHLAGTTNGLQCYEQATGRSVTGTFVDGLFTRRPATSYTPGWTHIVGATRSLFFYRSGDGLGASCYLDDVGNCVQPPGAVYDMDHGTAAFPGTRSGRFFFYVGESLAPVGLNANGSLVRSFPVYVPVGAGWTHGTGAGFNTVLFYRGDTGEAATGRIEASPAGGATHFEWVPRTTYRFGTGWTHVVGTFNGGILFYNRITGKGISGYLDDFANWHRTSPTLFDLGVGWTHVVGAGGRGLLFYHKTTGKAVGGFLTAAGAWTKTTIYG